MQVIAPSVSSQISRARCCGRAIPPRTSDLRYNETPNQYVTIEGTRLAYRTLGTDTREPPLVLLQHFTGTMDDWDPEVVEGLARSRRVYVFDNAGVGASGGVTPDSIATAARARTLRGAEMLWRWIGIGAAAAGGAPGAPP